MITEDAHKKVEQFNKLGLREFKLTLSGLYHKTHNEKKGEGQG